MPRISVAATYVVNNYTDLVNAINSINASPGTSPATSSNQVNITTASITAIANLPVLQNGATISSTVGGTTLSGGGTANLLATFGASLSLNNVALTNGLARGGNGALGPSSGTGGGGGLGAGGGVYVDANQTLTLVNATISSCTARGGNGGNGGTGNNSGGGGGGAASFSRTTANGVNASGSSGGGDYRGILNTPGASISTTFDNGYGGGDGGISGTQSSNPGLSTTAGGAGDGGSVGSFVAAGAGIGGAGGYCGGGGGGGGGSTSNIAAGGGGGGNGGGAGGNDGSTGGGGGGAGFGSGGGGVNANSVTSGGGGGGGFGGGGGGGQGKTSVLNVASGGGGGGGFGGGGGGTSTNLGQSKGGRYGGNGGSGVTIGRLGVGGGGGALGGGVFVGDGASLIFNDANGSAPASNISGNSVIAGTRGTGSNTGAQNGSTAGINIFLFRRASISFNGGADLTLASVIDVDTTATGINIDSGLTINTTSNAVITLSGANTYQGATRLNSGTLSIGADNNLGTAPSSSVATQITFAGGSLVTSNTFILSANRGITLNSGGGTVAPATGTTLTYNGIATGNGTLDKTGDGVLVLGGVNTYTGATNINKGTLRAGIANAIANSSAVTLANTAGAVFDANNLNQTINFLSGGGTSGGNISLGTAILTVNQTTAGTYAGSISGTGGLILSGSSSSALTLSGNNIYTGATTINGGTLIFANASGASAVTNNATMRVNTAFTTTANINNNSAFTMAGNLDMATRTFTNNGTMTINGVRTLTAANFTSAGTQNYTISGPSTADKLTTNAVVNLSEGEVVVASTLYFPSGTSLSWDLIEAGSFIIDSKTNINTPKNSCFSVWSSAIEDNILKILYEGKNAFVPLTGVDAQISNVLSAMNNLSVKNAGQTALVDSINSVNTQEQYTSALNSLKPNTSATPVIFSIQNILINKLESRVATDPQQIAMYASGDVAPDREVWLASYGSFAQQKAHDDYQGYRSKIYGFILGGELKALNDNMYGLALGLSNADVVAITDGNTVTRVLGTNLIGYGAAQLKNNNFLEWFISGSINHSKTTRSFIINSTGLSAHAKYNGALGGIKANFGKKITIKQDSFISPVASLQYLLIHQGAYQEAGSVAALSVSNKKNIGMLTLGAGLRLGKSYGEYGLVGSRWLRMQITYDAISPKQVTTANFVVGSNNFTMVNSPERVALNLGADYSLNLCKSTFLDLVYSLQLRRGYYENFLEAKLRYLF